MLFFGTAMEALVILTKSPGCTDQLQARASELSDFTRENHFECCLSVWTYRLAIVESSAKVADNYTVFELVRVKVAGLVGIHRQFRLKPNNITDLH
jgi:hypothetical protein